MRALQYLGPHCCPAQRKVSPTGEKRGGRKWSLVQDVIGGKEVVKMTTPSKRRRRSASIYETSYIYDRGSRIFPIAGILHDHIRYGTCLAFVAFPSLNYGAFA